MHTALARISSYIGKEAIPKNARNETARRAARAEVAKGGNCAEHADVAAMILNSICPKGTRINICTFPGLDYSFVVIGDMQNPATRGFLVVVDAWLPESQTVLASDFKFGNPQDIYVKRSFDADDEATDIVNKRLVKIKNLQGEELDVEKLTAEDVRSPNSFSDTRGNQVIVYEKDGSLEETSNIFRHKDHLRVKKEKPEGLPWAAGACVNAKPGDRFFVQKGRSIIEVDCRKQGILLTPYRELPSGLNNCTWEEFNVRRINETQTSSRPKLISPQNADIVLQEFALKGAIRQTIKSLQTIQILKQKKISPESKQLYQKMAKGFFS